MKFSTQISSLALAAVLALSGAAYAQTMVAGMSVSAEDLPKVQAHCDALALKQETASTSEPAEDETKAADATNPSADDADSPTNDEDAVDPSGSAQATTTIDLEILTYENCKEAGLVD